MISILLFILLLTFLIIIHELGHFVAAIWAKVRIEEFGVGLPPKILTLFSWRGIPFTLNWIFLGGFVRMEGEDVPQGGTNNQYPIINDQQKKKKTFPFYTRPLLQKLVVVIAGPFVNFAFGVIAFALIFSIYGIPTKVYTHPTLESVVAGSPADSAGMRAGDTLSTFETNQEFISFINAKKGTTVSLHLTRDGKEQTVELYARKLEETPEGQGAIGVILRSQYENKQFPLWQRPFRGASAGLIQSLQFGKMILTSLASIGQTLIQGRVPSDVSGPVGIASQVQKEGVFANGVLSTLNFAALLSINLAVMNMLPIPALDGGRALLLILEKVWRGRRFREISTWLNTAGFILLLGLLVLITIKDVISVLLKSI